MIKQTEILKDDTDTLADRHQLIACERADILAEHRNNAACRFLAKVKEVHQRCFPCTARAAEEVEGSCFKDEVNIRQDFGAYPVSQANVFKADHGVAAFWVAEAGGFCLFNMYCRASALR